ncbi:MAG: Type 1 glutamine amidotransferase-like domain-containing protein [Candidatus Portnoybacteria bacterium]|nr:Type 1 glutamine amidotransferase-like domain-containing protein [Candidatus Portnoybacteria bacterium]
MRILLLTSAGMKVEEEILKILPKPAHRIKIARIITAAKPERDTSYMEVSKRKMIGAGFQVEDIDIEGKHETELRALLRDKDVIYVAGGDTFYLLKCVKESGFDVVIKELVDRGAIYIGVSAGSYIACPTIEMAVWKHQDRNMVGLKDLTALNLVPFLLTVHYKSEHRELLREAIKISKYPVKILNDSQALLVKGNKVKLVGKGKEVKYKPFCAEVAKFSPSAFADSSRLRRAKVGEMVCFFALHHLDSGGLKNKMLVKKVKITTKDKKRYVLSTDEDWEILGKIYQLEKKKLSTEDKKFVTFIRTQLERDWRTPILQALENLLSRYE